MIGKNTQRHCEARSAEAIHFLYVIADLIRNLLKTMRLAKRFRIKYEMTVFLFIDCFLLRSLQFAMTHTVETYCNASLQQNNKIEIKLNYI